MLLSGVAISVTLPNDLWRGKVHLVCPAEWNTDFHHRVTENTEHPRAAFRHSSQDEEVRKRESQEKTGARSPLVFFLVSWLPAFLILPLAPTCRIAVLCVLCDSVVKILDRSSERTAI
jgi:hypothetical protein